jgi:PAS domain S-box-containing protein
MRQLTLRRSQTELERSAQQLTVELAELNSALVGNTHELEQSEERFQSQVRATSQILWTSTPAGRMEGFQTGWSTFTGRNVEEHQGFSWLSVIHPDDAQATRQAWNNAVAEKRPFFFEHRARRRDGIDRLFTVSALPTLNPDGSIREWVGVHIDITEHRQRQEERLAQEANFRFLADAMPQIVWTARADGWRDYFNQRWFDYTGTTLAATQGWTWRALLHPDDVERGTQMWQRSVAAGVFCEIEWRFRRASDATWRWHLARAVPLLDQRGVVLKWFGTCTDIQDYKEAEAENLRLTAELESKVQQRTAELENANLELRTSSRMLELSNGVLQDFASVAAHDLQEPLRKVQAFGDRLRLGYGHALDEQGQNYLGRMLSAASRMQILIHDLLAFSRVTSLGQPFVWVNLATVTRDVLSDLEERISETKATIVTGDLPAVEGDPLQLRQLLQNLIGNSLKFHRKGVPPVVRVHAAVAGDSGQSFEISVEDNGIGFDEKYLDRIFSVFQRLHARAEYEGTGIGLAICRKIALRHGGAITAHSIPGQGATFVVTWPRHVRAVPTTPLSSTRSEAIDPNKS